MNDNILVTGASGNVGTEIVKILIANGYRVRVAGINPAALRQRFDEKAESVLFDYARSETFTNTFQGIKRMFLMRPPQITDVKKYMLPAIDAAKLAGVEHIVFLSLIGIEQNQRVPHYAVEQYLIKSQIPYTFLRCSFFMQNLSTTHRSEIRDHDEIYLPVGHGKTSFIDVRDIATVAALALTNLGHENKAYELTGNEALDYYEVAEIFSQILERPITYRNPSAMQFLWREIRKGTHLPFALVMTWLYSSTRNGMAAQVTQELQQLLGKPSISLKQFVLDYKDTWK